jgi:membrane fusion protein, heavy metal efflux system
MSTRGFVFLSLVLTFQLSVLSNGFAHEGHDKAPGEEADESGGPITITHEAKENLRLTIEEAQIVTLEKSFTVFGQIESIPSKMSVVSSRISGQVTSLKVTEGESVKKGQPLVQIESRQLGNPPPRVEYSAQMDGVVTDRHVLLGDTVEPDKHLVEVVDLSEVYAEGRVFEGQIANVKVGQKVRVQVESFPNETFTGNLEIVSGSLDPESRTLEVWVRIQNAELKLRPNMRARLSIVTGEADSVVAIPHSAVLGEAGNYFVFVQSEADELTFERRAVVLGMKDDRYVEIIEGVFASDKVVTTGNYQLQYVSPKKKPEKEEESESKKPATETKG